MPSHNRNRAAGQLSFTTTFRFLFSAQPALCFTIPLFSGPQKLKTIALLDSGASACFLDEEFVKSHKFPLVPKISACPYRSDRWTTFVLRQCYP